MPIGSKIWYDIKNMIWYEEEEEEKEDEKAAAVDSCNTNAVSNQDQDRIWFELTKS